MIKINWYIAFILSGIFYVTPALIQADTEVRDEDSTQVMRAFTDTQSKDSDIIAIADQTKRQVMFFMGIPLILLLLATAALGVAMGVYGKQVFVSHMLCAGLSLTLALAHAVVGVVWFYPF